MKQTASQTVGPYFRIGLIYGEPQNVLVNGETAGEHIMIKGLVLDAEGEPINDAMIEIWQPDARGIFNHPADPLHEQADPHFVGFGRAENRDAGKFFFKTIKPGTRDGAAPYINVRVFARGILIHAVTRIYFADEPANSNDDLLNSIDPARRATLMAQREESDEIPTYRFDIHMQGDNETVFFDP
ncbi:MAG: protocatechuate 3,4-dioxygenase subunit alpha [Candidatus Promineifilaceae bacterium]|nr:protocatechuate 3,4-dioxygenase subunit alpha [Candidatus Promineifilaceae bacterium]